MLDHHKNDRDGNAQREVAEAFLCVREHVLPVVAHALEKTGPASLQILQLVLADVRMADGHTPAQQLADLTIYMTRLGWGAD